MNCASPHSLVPRSGKVDKKLAEEFKVSKRLMLSFMSTKKAANLEGTGVATTCVSNHS